MSCPYSNANHYILVGLESTYGTAVVPDKEIGIIQSYNPNEDNGTIKAKGSSSRETQDLIVGQYSISPTINYLFQNGRMFSLFFGGVSHAQTSTDWKHTFSIEDCPPSFTLEDGYNGVADSVSRVAGCKVNTLEASLELNGLLTINANLVGQKPVNNTSAQSAVISTIPSMSSYNSSILVGASGSEASVGGNLESFKLTLNNNLIPSEGHSSRFKQEFVADPLDIDFEFTLAFDSLTEYQRFLGSTSPSAGNITDFSLIWSVNNGITLGSGRIELYAEFNNVQYSTYNRAVSLGNKVIQTFKGSATTISDFYTVDNISSANWF